MKMVNTEAGVHWFCLLLFLILAVAHKCEFWEAETYGVSLQLVCEPLQLSPPAGISCGNWWQWCWSRQPGRTPSPGLCSFSCSPAAFTRWRPAAPTPSAACRHVHATSASSSTTAPSVSTAWVRGPSLRGFSSTLEASDAVLMTKGDY